MTYRTITVDGNDYLYTIGKKYVKVRGFEAAITESVGQIREYMSGCWCRDPSCGNVEIYNKFSVQPCDIASWIKSQLSICNS
jgi:hypothetical protein